MGILKRNEMLELNMFQSRFKQQSSITSLPVVVNFLSHSKHKACFSWTHLCLLKACTVFMVPKVDEPPGEA